MGATVVLHKSHSPDAGEKVSDTFFAQIVTDATFRRKGSENGV